MAERRMFAKTIIDSDAFLDMPLSTQALYFHLSMRADDDGFINNPKKIQRILGCADDDLKLLIAKRFIIPFESGIVVIKHWKIHNYIRSDRYKETIYKDEKQRLITKEDKSYKASDTVGIPDGNRSVHRLDTQVRSGKYIDNNKDIECEENANFPAPSHENIKISSASDDAPPTSFAKNCPCSVIINEYNRICTSLPRVLSRTTAREKAIKARWNEYGKDAVIFTKLFTITESSDFLKGKNERNWTASFDWLMKPANMAKVLEGNYNNKGSSGYHPAHPNYEDGESL